jgi:hypothetical protein
MGEDKQFQIKNNTGYLFDRTNKKTSPNQADFGGAFTVDNQEYYVSAWKNISETKKINYFNIIINSKNPSIQSHYDDSNDQVKNNRGFLIQQEKIDDKHPVLKGKIRINGDLLDVAAWDKYDKYNNLFYSCSIRTKNANQKQNMDNFIENIVSNTSSYTNNTGAAYNFNDNEFNHQNDNGDSNDDEILSIFGETKPDTTEFENPIIDEPFEQNKQDTINSIFLQVDEKNKAATDNNHQSIFETSSPLANSSDVEDNLDDLLFQMLTGNEQNN